MDFRFCKLDNINYLVLRYLNTSVLPFERFAEEWLQDVEVWLWCPLERSFGIGLMHTHLPEGRKRMFLRIRQRKKSN
jgi:hypothetical protein